MTQGNEPTCVQAVTSHLVQGAMVQGWIRGTIVARRGAGQVEGGTERVSVGVTSCTHAQVRVITPEPQVTEHCDHSPSCHLDSL